MALSPAPDPSRGMFDMWFGGFVGLERLMFLLEEKSDGRRDVWCLLFLQTELSSIELLLKNYLIADIISVSRSGAFVEKAPESSSLFSFLADLASNRVAGRSSIDLYECVIAVIPSLIRSG